MGNGVGTVSEIWSGNRVRRICIVRRRSLEKVSQIPDSPFRAAENDVRLVPPRGDVTSEDTFMNCMVYANTMPKTEILTDQLLTLATS